MAVRGIGTTNTGSEYVDSNFVGIVSGATLDSSNVVQLNFNDAVFSSSEEGRQRLIDCVDIIKDRLENLKVWPMTASS